MPSPSSQPSKPIPQQFRRSFMTEAPGSLSEPPSQALARAHIDHWRTFRAADVSRYLGDVADRSSSLDSQHHAVLQQAIELLTSIAPDPSLDTIPSPEESAALGFAPNMCEACTFAAGQSITKTRNAEAWKRDKFLRFPPKGEISKGKGKQVITAKSKAKRERLKVERKRKERKERKEKERQVRKRNEAKLKFDAKASENFKALEALKLEVALVVPANDKRIAAPAVQQPQANTVAKGKQRAQEEPELSKTPQTQPTSAHQSAAGSNRVAVSAPAELAKMPESTPTAAKPKRVHDFPLV